MNTERGLTEFVRKKWCSFFASQGRVAWWHQLQGKHRERWWHLLPQCCNTTSRASYKSLLRTFIMSCVRNSGCLSRFSSAPEEHIHTCYCLSYSNFCPSRCSSFAIHRFSTCWSLKFMRVCLFYWHIRRGAKPLSDNRLHHRLNCSWYKVRYRHETADNFHHFRTSSVVASRSKIILILRSNLGTKRWRMIKIKHILRYIVVDCSYVQLKSL